MALCKFCNLMVLHFKNDAFILQKWNEGFILNSFRMLSTEVPTLVKLFAQKIFGAQGKSDYMKEKWGKCKIKRK